MHLLQCKHKTTPHFIGFQKRKRKRKEKTCGSLQRGRKRRHVEDASARKWLNAAAPIPRKQKHRMKRGTMLQRWWLAKMEKVQWNWAVRRLHLVSVMHGSCSALVAKNRGFGSLCRCLGDGGSVIWVVAVVERRAMVVGNM
ncbi:hypothetical protein CIPAW_01G160700 [Carya illinoinensis]|uniref:Uncharacterized protein n=1 Tax=Carya illinoinensis TaxID=32201 RepID=A0A8T1RQY7_CARIL|nr:hypothetical protein CIPAW_01G160700 [Carya illinoinensis]